MSAAIQHNSSLSSLSPVQAQVINALAQGSSVTAAASAAGVHRTTIHHWMRTQKEFAAALDGARTDYVEQLSDELRELSAKALSTLSELLSDPNTPASVRLRAALAVLQRPSYPKQPWALPQSLESDEHNDFVRRVDYCKADYQFMRAEDALRRRNHDEPDAPPRPEPHPALDPVAGLIPRSSLCPCGSGRKYKRCCGIGAPAVIGH